MLRLSRLHSWVMPGMEVRLLRAANTRANRLASATIYKELANAAIGADYRGVSVLCARGGERAKRAL